VRAGFVPVGYSFNGTILTRTVCPNDATVYPVTTNFCLFGRNPNGSCCGSGPLNRCTKTGTQWAVIGALGGGLGALATGDVASPATAAGGIGGAGTGCLAGILRWG
jgi:hypothetical protein